MTWLLDRIHENRLPRRDGLVPFAVDGLVIGWIAPETCPRLAGLSDVFVQTDGRLTLVPGLPSGPAARTDAIEAALRRLYDADPRGFGRWCGERTPVRAAPGSAALFELERAAVALLGVLTSGVHLNGYVAEGLRVWLARRAGTLASHPGKLDQVAAGFLPLGSPPLPTLLDEADNEAGITPTLAARAVPSGHVTFCRRVPHGIQRGIVLTYDLALPDDFRPANRDGEIESFHLLAPDEVLRRLADAHAFKFDCALVAIDFLLRHGQVPDDGTLAAALRADPVPGAA